MRLIQYLRECHPRIDIQNCLVRCRVSGRWIIPEESTELSKGDVVEITCLPDLPRVIRDTIGEKA